MVGAEHAGPNVDMDVLKHTIISTTSRQEDYITNLFVPEEVVGQFLDLLGPGGTPHAHLSVRSDLAEDLPDLGLKPHVQHPVCLV